MARTHLFGSEETPGSQPTIAALQLKGLPDVSDLLEIERFVLPGPTALPIQDLSNLAITVMIQKAVDLSHNLGLRLSNLCDRQRLGFGETASCTAAEAHMNLNHWP